MARRQVQYDPDAPALSPAADARSVAYVPAIPQPALLPIREFAELSDTVARVSLDQEKRKAEEDQAAAERDEVLGAGDPIAAAHAQMDEVEAPVVANQDAFAKAEAKGEIRPEQNPWRAVGAEETGARKVMNLYQNSLTGLLSRATATVDEKGEPVQAESPDKLIAEAWDPLKDNPTVHGHYGGKIAVQEKQQIDAWFRQQAASGLAEARTQAMQTGASNEVHSRTLAEVTKKEDLSPETIAQFDARLQDLRRKGVPNWRGALFQGVMATASSVETADGPQEAADALRRLKALKVGTTTMGEDAEMGPKIDARIKQLEDDQETSASSKAAGQDAQLRLDKGAAERAYFARVEEVRKAGGGHADVRQVAREMKDTVLSENQYGENRDLVRRHLEDLGKATLVEDSQSLREDLLARLTVIGGVADAEARLELALRNGEISTDDHTKITAAIADRRSVGPLLEGSNLTAKVDEDLNRAASLAGLPVVVASDLQPQVDAIRSAFEAERTAFAQGIDPNLSLSAKNELMREFYAKRQPEVDKKLREVSALPRDRRRENQLKVDDMIRRGIHPGKKGLLDPTIYSADEINEWNRKGDLVGDRTRFLHAPDYRQAVSGLQETIAAKLEGVPAGQVVQQQIALSQVFEGEFLGNLEGILETNEPSAVPGKIQEYLNAATSEFMQRVGTSRLEALKESMGPQGEGPESVQAQAEVADASAEDARAVQSLDPAEAAKVLTKNRDANVPPATYTMLEKYLAGSTGFAGLESPITRTQMQDHLVLRSRELLIDPARTPEERAAAAVSMWAPFGIPAEDALADRIVPTPSPEWAANQGRLRNGLMQVNYVNPDPGLERKLRAVDVGTSTRFLPIPIKGAPIPPYTTNFFPGGPATVTDDLIRKLAKKYGVPEGPDALRKFKAQQLILSSRSSNAR